MNEISPTAIRKQIAYLKRILAELRFCFTLAYYAQDDVACHEIRGEYRLTTDLIRQLRGELAEFEKLQREQVAAVAQVCKWLETES